MRIQLENHSQLQKRLSLLDVFSPASQAKCFAALTGHSQLVVSKLILLEAVAPAVLGETTGSSNYLLPDALTCGTDNSVL